MGLQEIHEHEASGGDGAGAAGRVSSSQVTKRQGQDKRRTAALDPLRPDRPNVTKGRRSPPVIDFCQIPESNLRINLDTTFACNNDYCINEKKAIKLLETFEHKPEKYTEKVNHIFEVLGISLFECYDMTEKLYNEVNEIVSEINNFLNEESSDERKQI